MDSVLGSGVSQILHETINYVDSRRKDYEKEKSKQKYRKASSEGQTSRSVTNPADSGSRGSQSPSASYSPGDGLPVPRRVLFDPARICLRWKAVRKVGCGLINLGNTCFLNSVLQCLAYTPPLVQYLESGDHSRSCQAIGFCALCVFEQHVKRVFSGGAAGALKPSPITNRLKVFAKHFRFGRQEDAHEFLRYFIEALQKCCLAGLPPKLDLATKQTSFIHQVFGGYHRSLVLCTKCRYESKTYDPLLDISLDIKHATTLTKAFEEFVKADVLDGANKYMCPKCKCKVKALKHFSIHRAPNVLTIQLKRFDFCHKSGGKITKKIAYGPSLNLRPYMSESKGDPIMYDLYGVLVHAGHSVHSGHYYCFVRSSTSICYNLDDSYVRQVGAQTMLSQQAYLLFYVKRPAHAVTLAKSTPKSSTSTPIAKASHTSPVEKALHTSSSPSKSLPAKVSRDSVADKASKLPGKHGEGHGDVASRGKTLSPFSSIPKMASWHGGLQPSKKGAGVNKNSSATIISNGHDASLCRGYGNTSNSYTTLSATIMSSPVKSGANTNGNTSLKISSKHPRSLSHGAPTVSFREMIDDREGRKRKSDDDKETGSEMKKVKVKTWDGRVDSAVSKQLTASTVYDTWDKSKVSVFSKPTRPSMSETSLADAEDETWNEEYDKPKEKKVKKKMPAHPVKRPQGNLFQKAYDYAQVKKKRFPNGMSASGCHFRGSRHGRNGSIFQRRHSRN